jgi:hypothetical protein
VQLHRAVDKILDAQQSSLATILKRAVLMGAKTTKVDDEIAKSFQYSTRCERGDRIFLEVCLFEEAGCSHHLLDFFISAIHAI